MSIRKDAVPPRGTTTQKSSVVVPEARVSRMCSGRGKLSQKNSSQVKRHLVTTLHRRLTDADKIAVPPAVTWYLVRSGVRAATVSRMVAPIQC
jgi:hypothetical protein